jgi:hypothetical protein
LEGRLRALEALILEMPGVTSKLIESAHTRVRKDVKRRDSEMAEVMFKIGGHYDKFAEEALERLGARIRR